MFSGAIIVGYQKNGKEALQNENFRRGYKKNLFGQHI